MKCKSLTIAAIVLSFSLLATAQLPTIQSPDVAAINKFIDIPVNKSTGIPSVNIPIYTFKEKDFLYPISINYHGGGIRVDEQASSVGLGWSLNAGGTISRSVKKYADEMGGYYAEYGFDTIPPHIHDGIWEILSSAVDLEPDLFYYNINNYSGKFLFDNQRRAQLIPEQDIKVYENYYAGTFSFRLVTPDGAQYFFDNTHYNYTNTASDAVSDFSNTPIAWNLMKIITPTQQEINFEYEQCGMLSNRILPARNLTETNSSCVLCANLSAYTTDRSYRITRIYSDASEVLFRYKSTTREDHPSGSSTKAIDTIIIKDRIAQRPVKSFAFNTDYFICSDSVSKYQLTTFTVDNYLRKRLRLNEVTEVDSNGIALPPYKFFYNKTNPIGGTPNRISTGQDHWGYYNRISSNNCLIANYQAGTANCTFMANREVDSAYKKAYVLDEIHFPTGGITTLKYYSDFSPGLKVQEQITYPQFNQDPLVKQYTYENEHVVGGGPIYSQEYEYFDSSPFSMAMGSHSGTYMLRDDGSGCDLNFSNYRYVAFSNPVNHSGELSSQYAVYEKVTEKLQNNGSIETYYNTGEASSYFDDIGIYPFIFKRPILEIGEPLREVVKDVQGNPLKETLYEYGGYYRKIVNKASGREWRFPCAHIIRLYSLYTGFRFLKRKQVILYDNKFFEARGLNTTTDYEYGGLPEMYHNWGGGELPDTGYFPAPLHHMVTKETTVSSDSAIVINRMKYPKDFESAIGTPGGGDTFDDASKSIYHLIAKNQINQPVEQLTTVTRAGNEKITGGKLTQYKVIVDSSSYKVIGSHKVYSLNLPSPQNYSGSSFSTITKTGAVYSFNQQNQYGLQSENTQWDQKANIIDATNRDGIKRSFLWGYKKMLPVTVALNTLQKDIFYTSFEEDNGGDIVSNGFTGQKSKTNGFTQALTGLTNGTYTLRYWQKNTTWSLQTSSVNVTGGNYTINLSGQVDEIRFFPINAQLTTYTYHPFFGITSINDPNDIVTTYEYDGLGRLVRQRDEKQYILKQFNYGVQQTLLPSAAWKKTGLTRCKPCFENLSFNSGIRQQQLIDTNISSTTYNVTTWVDEMGKCDTCNKTTDWQATGGQQCAIIPGTSYNYGYKEIQQRNMNPCSNDYLQFRWIPDQMDTTTCPLPMLYVKLVYENYEDQGDYIFADVWIKVFVDAACTIPAPFYEDRTINYRIVNSCTGTSNLSVPVTGLTGGALYTGTHLLYPDGPNSCTVTYSLRPGYGYTIVND